MSSGTEIILAALKQIGANSIVSPAQPGAITTGRDTLNSMLQRWLSLGIDLETIPLNAPGDELSEPLDAKEVIINNLSIALAPNFDNGKVVVSQTLKNNARRDYYDIKSLYQVLEIPPVVVSSTLPRGQGNAIFGNRQRVFAGKGARISSSDS